MSKKKNDNVQSLNEIENDKSSTNSASDNATATNNTSKVTSKSTSKKTSNSTSKKVDAKPSTSTKRKSSNKKVAVEDTKDEVIAGKEETNNENEVITDKEEANNENEVITDKEEVNNENEVIADKEEANNENEVITDKEEANNENEVKKSHKKFIIISVVCCIVLLLCLVFSMIFAFLNSYSSTIIHGVFINGIDVSGLTIEDAKAKISSIFEDVLEKPITLTHNEYKTTIFPSQFDVCCSIDEIVDTAYQEGRDKNIFKSNFEILETLFFGNNISLDFDYSEETLDSLITEMETNFSDRFVDSSYYVEGNFLVLSKGQNGIVIEKEKLKSNLLSAIMNFDVSIDCMEIPTIYKEVNSLDISKIYQEVYRAPQDAYYTTDPFVIYPHVDGIDFSISQEEAQKLLDEAQEDCKIPLKVLSPNVTTNQIGTEAFPDLLSTYYTKI